MHIVYSSADISICMFVFDHWIIIFYYYYHRWTAKTNEINKFNDKGEIIHCSMFHVEYQCEKNSEWILNGNRLVFPNNKIKRSKFLFIACYIYTPGKFICCFTMNSYCWVLFFFVVVLNVRQWSFPSDVFCFCFYALSRSLQSIDIFFPCLKWNS